MNECVWVYECKFERVVIWLYRYKGVWDCVYVCLCVDFWEFECVGLLCEVYGCVEV